MVKIDVNPRHYSFKKQKSIYLFTKPTGQKPLSLLTFFNIPINTFCRRCTEVALKLCTLKNFGFFVIFVFNLRYFSGRKQQFFSEKPTGPQVSALLNVFSVLMLDLYRKFVKDCIETLNSKNFGLFVIFGNSKNRIYFFKNDYWTTNFCIVELFEDSSSRCLSKL